MLATIRMAILSVVLVLAVLSAFSAAAQTSAAWFLAPPTSQGARQGCPDSGTWLLLYWGGASTPVNEAAAACPAADRIWSNVGGRWLGFSPGIEQASDTFPIERGAAAFVRVRSDGDMTLSGDFQWQPGVDSTRVTSLRWSAITTSRLTGFGPAGQISEKKSEGCQGRTGAFLRVEGGLCAVGYFLEVNRGVTVSLRSADELRAAFAPIDSAEKAVSFVAVLTSDLRVNPGDVLAGLVAADGNDFYVQVIRKNTFGCGSHEPTNEVHKVSADGAVARVAFEPQKPPLPGRPILCVD